MSLRNKNPARAAEAGSMAHRSPLLAGNDWSGEPLLLIHGFTDYMFPAKSNQDLLEQP